MERPMFVAGAADADGVMFRHTGVDRVSAAISHPDPAAVS